MEIRFNCMFAEGLFFLFSDKHINSTHPLKDLFIYHHLGFTFLNALQ